MTKFSTFFLNKFAAKSCKCFPPHLHNDLAHATTELSEKVTQKFIPTQL